MDNNTKERTMEEKLAQAEAVIKLFQSFDYRRGHIEARVFLGEIDEKYSAIVKNKK